MVHRSPAPPDPAFPQGKIRGERRRNRGRSPSYPRFSVRVSTEAFPVERVNVLRVVFARFPKVFSGLVPGPVRRRCFCLQALCCQCFTASVEVSCRLVSLKLRLDGGVVGGLAGRWRGPMFTVNKMRLFSRPIDGCGLLGIGAMNPIILVSSISGPSRGCRCSPCTCTVSGRLVHRQGGVIPGDPVSGSCVIPVTRVKSGRAAG